jgi:urate oxidase
MAQLAENHYGKSHVRLLKVTREATPEQASEPIHTVYEWSVGVYLTGDFDACYRDGDNTGLLATDTMKNTVYAVARGSSATTPETFAIELARFLAGRKACTGEIRITVEAKTWMHLSVDKPAGDRVKHGTAFLQRGPDVATASVTLAQADAEPHVVSGVKGLVILKTAHSAFFGFRRDELTTLPETRDRLLGTEASIDWTYAVLPAEFSVTRRLILDTLLTAFALHDSLSVQQSLFAMAEAVLARVPEVAELTLVMPNRHNIPIDFSRFQPPYNSDNPNSIFVPTDEPSGHIHARVTR